MLCCASVHFELKEPGLFVAHYDSAADLLPRNQTDLVEQLSQSCAQRPTAIVFAIADGIAWIDPTVPKYWLTVTGRLRLVGMAMVTHSAGVRVAASGFRLANSVRRIQLPVETFENEASALAWLRPLLRQHA